ncbi:MAG TPA: hypothetical protein VK181_09215, partial [Rhizobium sp.]|nr:hypothetical protein [Rhizobium sp.]
MNHVDVLALKRNAGLSLANKSLVSRATGSFFTHERIGRFMNERLVPLLVQAQRQAISVADPFAGDGRLVYWLIECAVREGVRARWKISLWDNSSASLAAARQRFDLLAENTGADIEVDFVCADSFELIREHEGSFDVVVTNPPWEALKPDRRELAELTPKDRDIYVGRMRAVDRRLAQVYPHSQPTRKFAGWGTNLSRVGFEASVRLLADGGHLGIVLPSSTFADQVSTPLRHWATERLSLKCTGYFPAEARLFENVDQASMALVGTKNRTPEQQFDLHV